MKNNIAYFNGIDPDTGGYFTNPMPLHELASHLSYNVDEKPLLVFMRNFLKQLKKPKLGPVFGIDPNNLGEAGWGIIFHQNETQSVRDNLEDLISHRNGRVLEYKPGESKDQWLRRHGVGPGSVDPKRVPYYLLIVGEPTLIPFEFQYHLDVQYAVGRISFDTPQEYKNYSQSVIQHEQYKPYRVSKSFAVFGTHHNGDPATELSSMYLAGPVASEVTRLTNWACKSYIGSLATKENLLKLLASSDESPSLIFSACHGVGYKNGDNRQWNGQGAWVCQDWPGNGPLETGHLFSKGDISSGMNLSGKIIFSFSCFGAGTPQRDEFDNRGNMLAPNSFVSSLAKKLMSYSQGGLLAYIGHVDRAWGYSFLWEGIGSQPQTIISTISNILMGTRIGHATSEINLRYAELSTMLVDNLQAQKEKRLLENEIIELARLWVARNDARNYIIIGDPAIRLTK